MDISKQKEQFSIAYVQAIAAQLGLKSSFEVVDDDSVDISFKGTGFKGGKSRNPMIEVQMKCTSQDVVKGDVIKYALKIKNYNDLRGEDVTVPRYLMLLIVPDKPEDWSKFCEKGITLYNHCYWASLRYMPATKNTTSVSVELSIEHKVTDESLMRLMVMASNAEYE